MEDDNGLDLSLSLPYGGQSSSFKAKNGIVSEANRDSKLIDDFKNFLDGRCSEVQEVRQDTGSKRKNPFDERNYHIRHEREACLVDLHDKSHKLTNERLTARSEDVADSETEVSTKRHMEVNGVSNSNGANLHGLRRFPILLGKEFKAGHVSYGVPFSGQSVNSNHMSGTVSSGYTSSSMVRLMAPASNNGPETQQPVVPATLPLMFGYSPIQMPTVEPATMPSEEVSSSHGMARVTGDQSRADTCPPERPTIMPGITTEVKFGGNGSSPNLPWVSATGPGPNGKTISGVTYKHSGTHVRVVCACHGSHMSVEEFVLHASQEQPDPTDSNPAASPQS